MKEKKQKVIIKHSKVSPEVSLDANITDIFDYFVPNAFEEGKSSIYLGRDTVLRTYALVTYPREIYIGWLDEFFNLGNIRITTYLENIPDSVVIKQLTSKVVSTQSSLIVYENRGDVTNIPALRTSLADLESVREAIQTNLDRMFIVNITITIYAKTEEQLEEKCYEFETICARKSIYPRSYDYRQKDAFIGSLPLGTLNIRDFDRNMTTGGTACVIPVTNADMSHKSGILLGSSLQTGAPVFYDRFIGPPHLTTQHIYVAGKSGSGKSVTLKLLTSRSALDGGIKTIVFDPEAEYRNVIINMLGGEYLTIKAGHKAGMNPLDLEEEIEEDGRYVVDIYEKIADIRALIGSFVRNFAGRPLHPVEMTGLEEATREIYSDRGINSTYESLFESGGAGIGNDSYKIGNIRKKMPTLSDLHKKIGEKPNCSELYEIMKPLVGDGSLAMFDCESTTNLGHSMVLGFNMKEIRDEFTKFYATFVLINYAWTKFVQKDRKKKSLVLDEAWMFIKYPESAEFLETVARRGRKYNASLVVATQNIEEFISCKEGRAVINACSTMILLQQNPGVVGEVVEAFKLSSGCANLLETFSPGEAILTLNGSATAIRVTPAQFEWEYMTTNPQDLIGA